jgi:hypothetical protein
MGRRKQVPDPIEPADVLPGQEADPDLPPLASEYDLANAVEGLAVVRRSFRDALNLAERDLVAFAPPLPNHASGRQGRAATGSGGVARAFMARSGRQHRSLRKTPRPTSRPKGHVAERRAAAPRNPKAPARAAMRITD